MPSQSTWQGISRRFYKETRMEKRILAVLIAALAGGAYAQTYQNSNTAPAQKATAAQPAGATATTANPPPSRGYVGSGAGVVATNPYGLCWRSGADWSPDKAAAPCDAVPRASVPPAPVAQAPEPVAAPIAAAPAPEPVVIEKITLSTDVLFPSAPRSTTRSSPRSARRPSPTTSRRKASTRVVCRSRARARASRSPATNAPRWVPTATRTRS